jgi:N utilization substance protein A
VKELNNEKIDVVNWSSEPAIFISRALSPAKPVKVIVDEANKKVEAVISDDQISLAIGKGGQNRQLASMLTGYEITTVKQSEWEKAQEKEETLSLTQVEELSKNVVEKLIAAGYETAEDVLEAGKPALLELKGFGEKTVERIFEVLSGYFEEESQNGKPTGPTAPAETAPAESGVTAGSAPEAVSSNSDAPSVPEDHPVQS